MTMTKTKNNMEENKNWRMFARRFEDTTERIEAIREFVTDNIAVGIDYADKANPVLNLYEEGESRPFTSGNVGDYVVNDNGNFRIVEPKDLAEVITIIQQSAREEEKKVAARAGDWVNTNCDHSYEIAIRAYVAGYYDAMKGKRWK